MLLRQPGQFGDAFSDTLCTASPRTTRSMKYFFGVARVSVSMVDGIRFRAMCGRLREDTLCMTQEQLVRLVVCCLFSSSVIYLRYQE